MHQSPERAPLKSKRRAINYACIHFSFVVVTTRSETRHPLGPTIFHSKISHRRPFSAALNTYAVLVAVCRQKPRHFTWINGICRTHDPEASGAVRTADVLPRLPTAGVKNKRAQPITNTLGAEIGGDGSLENMLQHVVSAFTAVQQAGPGDPSCEVRVRVFRSVGGR